MTDQEYDVIGAAIAFVEGRSPPDGESLRASVLALKVEREAQARDRLLEFIAERAVDICDTSAQRLHRIKNAISQHETAHVAVLGEASK